MNVLVSSIILLCLVPNLSGEEVICNCEKACSADCLRCKDSNNKVYHSCFSCKGRDKPAFDHNCKQGCNKCVFCKRTVPPVNERFLGCNSCPQGSTRAPGEFNELQPNCNNP